MKIFEVCISSIWGGLEIYSNNLAFALAKHGHNVFFVVQEGSKLEYEIKERMKLSLHTKNRNKTLLNVISVNPSKFYFKALIKLRDMLKKINPDIIHIHVSSNLWLVRIASLGLEIKPKIIFTDHVASIYPKKDILHRWLFKKITYGVSTTERGKKLMLKYTPLQENKIIVLSYGIDTEKFLNKKRCKVFLRKKYNLPLDGIIIGNVSRIDPKKGQMEFLKAAEIIIKERKENIYFVIVGGSEPGKNTEYEMKLKDFVKNKELLNKIFFLGHQENIPEILACLDIFVFSSYSEAFGLVVLESQCAGLPVIATNSGGIPEIIKNGETGLLVKPKNEIELSEAIKKLLSDERYRNKISIKGQENVLRNYTFEKHLFNIEKLYRGDLSFKFKT